MFQKDSSRLVEICPQCLHGINETTARLVSDSCGHKKCRICLLQEANGCLKCIGESVKASPPVVPQPPRKTVITSTHLVKTEKPNKDVETTLQNSSGSEKEILFPTHLVNKTSGNFMHLKRSISERYFREGKCNKEDKCCGTDPTCFEAEMLLNLPSHINYFCALHRAILTEENSLQEHLTCTKDDDNVFKCSSCDIVFESSYKLNRHNRCHAPTSKYQCDVCLKRFKDNYALKAHYRKHSGDKVYACNLCDVKLAQLWSLKRHIAKHNGERNYLCETCDMKFLTKVDLTRHLASHSTVKLFSCRKCGAKFKFRRSLTRHAASHYEGTFSVPCHLCAATFKRKDNLHRHLKNTHNLL